jgi:uncharacterized membrane protein
MKSYYRKKSFEDNRKSVITQQTADYIRSMRGQIKQMDLAKQVGISQCHISAIQNNKYHINKNDD